MEKSLQDICRKLGDSKKTVVQVWPLTASRCSCHCCVSHLLEFPPRRPLFHVAHFATTTPLQAALDEFLVLLEDEGCRRYLSLNHDDKRKTSWADIISKLTACLYPQSVVRVRACNYHCCAPSPRFLHCVIVAPTIFCCGTPTPLLMKHPFLRAAAILRNVIAKESKKLTSATVKRWQQFNNVVRAAQNG